MLNDTFADCLGDLPESMKIVFKGLLEEAAASIIKELDADGSQVLEWNEFKQYMQAFSQKKTNLMHIIQRAKDSSTS